MRVISELVRLISESNLVAVKSPKLEVVDDSTLKRTMKIPELKGEVVVIQHGDLSGGSEWPRSPDVSLNTLTRRLVIQPGKRSDPVSEIHATGTHRVLVTGLSLKAVSAHDRGNVIVKTDSDPKVSAKGKGKVTIKPLQ